MLGCAVMSTIGGLAFLYELLTTIRCLNSCTSARWSSGRFPSSSSSLLLIRLDRLYDLLSYCRFCKYEPVFTSSLNEADDYNGQNLQVEDEYEVFCFSSINKYVQCGWKCWKGMRVDSSCCYQKRKGKRFWWRVKHQLNKNLMSYFVFTTNTGFLLIIS